MSMSTEDKIRHYQRSIDRSLLNKPRLLHCIEMLSKLPVTVNHLQITGVGRTVNALRKIEEGVGDAAKQLVTKWKVMVANHVDTSEDEDEACVPDVPECYESPDCDSEPENEITQRENNANQNRPEALRSVISDSPPLVVDDLDTDNITDIPPSSSNNHREDNSDEESEISPNKSSSSRHSSSSVEHSPNKNKHSKKDSESKSAHKDKSSNSHSSHSKNSHNLEVSDHKKKNKNKSESSSSHKDKKHSDDRKRKYESSSSERESDKKKKRVSESEIKQEEEDNVCEENVSSQDENSEDEVLEGEEENCKDTVKEKAKDKQHSSSSKQSKSKSHESRDKSRKDKKSSKSDGRGKEENSKSEEHRSKESSKSKSSHSSSSSKNHSKDRDKDKHSKDKNKESSSKCHNDEKDRSSKKEIKDDRGKSKEQEKKDKECKESKPHKEHKEDKEHKDHKDHKEQKEHKEKKKPKIADGGIDCNSGTSFADALGMCTIPPPKKKKENSSSSSKSKDSPILSLSSNSSTSISKSSSSKSSVKVKSNPPDCPESLSLLSSNVKLEPLNRLDEEVDLASTLPEPSPYYKPLPHINHAQRRQDEDEMLSQVIYAKNQRTKVYSGNKSGYTTVPSLYEMCIRILIENIDALEFTGGVPYFIIKPVLERATADQLFMLEHHNPYLIEDSDPLWQFHCNKDFRTKKREEMESWREMYMRCLDEREAKLKALTANIKQSIDNSQPVRSTKLAYVDNIVKPPRSVMRKQAKYGTANSNTSASDLKKKLITGVIGNSGASSNSNSNSNSSTERISVPPPPTARSRQPSSSTVKKTKAPLMAKALQAIKGRYKR